MAKTKLKISEARAIADKYIKLVEPYCERIEIAGSTRREKPFVGDIEIVAKPLVYLERDMFGNITGMEVATDKMQPLGQVIKGGSKYKQYLLSEGICLDLFLVTPLAQWGIIFMLRTGSGEFNTRWVKKRNQGGLLPSDIVMQDGCFYRYGKLIPTPEEEDVFRVLGIDYIPPKERI